MMIFTVLCVAISITLSQAYDCVCPTKEISRVFPKPYLYNEAEIMIKTSDCLAVRAYYKEWYNVIIDEKTGYVHESDIRMDPTCDAGLKTRKERFVFSQMKAVFTTMACASSCIMCKCGTFCSHTVCSPCNDIMCPEKPQAGKGHSQPSTVPRFHWTIAHTNSPVISTSQGSSMAINSTNSPSKTLLHGLRTTIRPTNSTSKTITSIYSTSKIISPTNSTSKIISPTNSTSKIISPTNSTSKIISPTNSTSTSTSTLHQIIVTKANPCLNSPCLNGGICLPKHHRYQCFCRSHPGGSVAYTGTRCELQVNVGTSMITSTAQPKWLVIHGK